PQGLCGDAYRRARAQAAWALQAFSQLLPARALPLYPWREIAAMVAQSPKNFLAGVSTLRIELGQSENCQDFLEKFSSLDSFTKILQEQRFPQVVQWSLLDQTQIPPIPPNHWLLIEDTVPFRAILTSKAGKPVQQVESIPANA